MRRKRDSTTEPREIGFRSYAGGAREGELRPTAAECEACTSAGAIRAIVLEVIFRTVPLTNRTGMWETWQIGQEASEPGVSLCQYEAPTAMRKTAKRASNNAVPRNQRRSSNAPFRREAIPEAGMVTQS